MKTHKAQDSPLLKVTNVSVYFFYHSLSHPMRVHKVGGYILPW